MELDFSSEWRVIGPAEGVASAGAVGEGASEGPGAFAARELVSTLIRMGCRAPTLDEVGDAGPLIVLHQGKACPDLESGDRCRLPCFSWRASSSHVEIFGENGDALLRGAYDFLQALGARWVEPGAGGERLPRGPVLRLAETSRRSDAAALATTLILGPRRLPRALGGLPALGGARRLHLGLRPHDAPMPSPWAPRPPASTRPCALR